MSKPTENPEGKYPLHYAVFLNDTKILLSLLNKGHDINRKDMHGNRPLHLAVMLGHNPCIKLLLEKGAKVKGRNLQGWGPMAEAISYGDRDVIAVMLKKLTEQQDELALRKKPEVIKVLKDFGDFVIDFKWDFKSWVPLVSRMLPSDECKLTKKGVAFRLDTTLVDFSEMGAKRGDVSILFRGDAEKMENSVFLLDNEEKLFVRPLKEAKKLKGKELDKEIEEDVDLLMTSDIVSSHMSTKPITFTKKKSGWIFKEDKKEKVGQWQADFYEINGMALLSRRRREHLTDKEIKENSELIKKVKKGDLKAVDEHPPQKNHPSLKPPPKTDVTWEKYTSAMPGENPRIGRKMVIKETEKTFKASVAMSQEFPLTVKVLIDILEVVAPQFKHMEKLKDFIKLKLPPGFPVKVDIPVVPTISARVQFKTFEWKSDIDDALFKVPKDYKEDLSFHEDPKNLMS